MAAAPYELFGKTNWRPGGIERFGLPAGGWKLYYTDIFHTMLNMPRYRFLTVFFAVYVLQYVLFALLYLTQPDICVGATMKWSHAIWFSVQTAATLGYSGPMAPNIDCTSINMLVLIQVIFASLLDYCMMGLVFARFSTPVNRSQTIRFSSNAVLFRQEGGFWCLSFRVANIRKHSLLQPQLFLHLAIPDKINNAIFSFDELEIDALSTQVVNLKMGLPATVTHTIKPGSPLFELSLDEMESRELGLLCFMDGVDPMTSNTIQAKHHFCPSDIRMNEKFTAIDLKQRRGGQVGLDFSGFDNTVLAALSTYNEEDHSLLYPVSATGTSTMDNIRHHMNELRSKTIRSLTEVGNAVVNNAEMGVPKLHLAKDDSVKELCDLILTCSDANDPSLLKDLRRRSAWIKETLMSIEHASGRGQWRVSPPVAQTGGSGLHPGLFSYDLKERTSWRIEHPSQPGLDAPTLPLALAYNNVAGRPPLLAVACETGFISLLPATVAPDAFCRGPGRHAAMTWPGVAPVKQWRAHENMIFDLVWGKDDTVLYTASADATVRVWDAGTGACLASCIGHEGSVKSISVMPDSTHILASGSRDGSIKVWDTRVPGRKIRGFNCLSSVWCKQAAHAPAGGSGSGGSSSKSGSKRSRDVQTPAPSVTAVQYLSSGLLASGGMGDGTVKVWDLRNATAAVASASLAQPLSTPPPPSRPADRPPLPPPTPMTPLTGGGGKPPAGTPGSAQGRGGGIHKSGGGSPAGPGGGDRPVHSFFGRSTPRNYGIHQLALAPAGDMLLMSGSDSTLQMFRVAGSQLGPVATFTGHEVRNGAYVRVAISPDGSMIAGGSFNGDTLVWEVSRPSQPACILKGHESESTGVAWQPHTAHPTLASCGDDKCLLLWQLDRQPLFATAPRTATAVPAASQGPQLHQASPPSLPQHQVRDQEPLPPPLQPQPQLRRQEARQRQQLQGPQLQRQQQQQQRQVPRSLVGLINHHPASGSSTPNLTQAKRRTKGTASRTPFPVRDTGTLKIAAVAQTGSSPSRIGITTSTPTTHTAACPVASSPLCLSAPPTQPLPPSTLIHRNPSACPAQPPQPHTDAGLGHLARGATPFSAFSGHSPLPVTHPSRTAPESSSRSPTLQHDPTLGAAALQGSTPSAVLPTDSTLTNPGGRASLPVPVNITPSSASIMRTMPVSGRSGVDMAARAAMVFSTFSTGRSLHRAESSTSGHAAQQPAFDNKENAAPAAVAGQLTRGRSFGGDPLGMADVAELGQRRASASGAFALPADQQRRQQRRPSGMTSTTRNRQALGVVGATHATPGGPLGVRSGPGGRGDSSVLQPLDLTQLSRQRTLAPLALSPAVLQRLSALVPAPAVPLPSTTTAAHTITASDTVAPPAAQTDITRGGMDVGSPDAATHAPTHSPSPSPQASPSIGPGSDSPFPASTGSQPQLEHRFEAVAAALPGMGLGSVEAKPDDGAMGGGFCVASIRLLPRKLPPSVQDAAAVGAASPRSAERCPTPGSGPARTASRARALLGSDDEEEGSQRADQGLSHGRKRVCRQTSASPAAACSQMSS
ncbi:MAG: hypothetical protein WDW38_004114 [Sanguina aurantia]